MPREIRTTSRGLRTEFEQSISGDIVKALVEVVTNSDDSYTRAGKDGPIDIRFGKPRTGAQKHITPVSITDHAEGMNEKDMSLAADVGVEASGFAKKKTIRGLLGRGLKQAAFGIGEGAELESIKGGVLSIARLYDGENQKCMFAKGSELSAVADSEADQPPCLPTAEEREALGLPAPDDGTRVTLLASKELWKTNQHQAIIRERLQTHYALRALLENSAKRPLSVTEKDGTKHGPLEYLPPKADPEKPVVKTSVDIPGFPKAKAHLTLWRSATDLGPVDDYSESGVIIYSEGVPIVQTLFGREGNSLAGRFFGRLDCDYIAELLKEENAKGSIKLITLQRHGFVSSHPFAKALTKAVQSHIDKALQAEAEREKKEKAEQTNAGLQKALDSLVPELNKLLSSLLDPMEDTTGTVKTKETGPVEPPSVPPTTYYQPLLDLEFFPEELGVRAHAEKQTTLYIRDAAFSDKHKVEITVEGGGIKVLTHDLHVDHTRSSTKSGDGPVGYSKVPFRVEGIQAGTNAIVHASIGATEAMLLVTVGGYKEPQPPKPKLKGSILKEIVPGHFEGKYRAHFDVVSGALKVNLNHPLLKLYEGVRYEADKAKRRPWATAIADAMTDALCRVIISTMIEERHTIPRQDGMWDRTMKELDVLWYSLGTSVHNVVETKLLSAN
jgi:Histidine kinase-, DNA gyrase B-, and HSP90-like ATPase